MTLDGVSVNPAAGDSSPTIVAGGNFIAGMTTHAGGTVNGGVQYGGTSSVAQNFTINGGLTHAAPGFSFATEFTSLKTLSASLSGLPQSPGATVSLAYGALTLTGTATGLNVFTVDAAQLAQAAGIVINLTQPGATALINVNTATILSIAPMYMSLSGSATATGILWNLPLATGFNVTFGVAWQGTILAPNADVTGLNHPQLSGQLIAASVPDSSWVINRVEVHRLPPAPAARRHACPLPLCASTTNGVLDMRLRNIGDQTRAITWTDLTGSDSGSFAVPAHSDFFFYVRGGGAGSVVRATAGTTTVQANGTGAHCQGQITVQLVTEGDAPAGQTWDVHLTNGDSGNVSSVLTLASGQSETTTVPGGYVGGAAAIDEVVGGAAYTISVDDPHGALSTSISLNPVQILDGQNEFVTVTLVYGTGGGPETGPPVEPPTGPGQPTLPPGAPDPPLGPDLVGGTSGADLSITHQITPARLPVGGTVETVTRVTNLGPQAAEGVVAREIPQYHPRQANKVARRAVADHDGWNLHTAPARALRARDARAGRHGDHPHPDARSGGRGTPQHHGGVLGYARHEHRQQHRRGQRHDVLARERPRPNHRTADRTRGRAAQLSRVRDARAQVAGDGASAVHPAAGQLRPGQSPGHIQVPRRLLP